MSNNRDRSFDIFRINILSSCTIFNIMLTCILCHRHLSHQSLPANSRHAQAQDRVEIVQSRIELQIIRKSVFSFFTSFLVLSHQLGLFLTAIAEGFRLSLTEGRIREDEDPQRSWSRSPGRESTQRLCTCSSCFQGELCFTI